MAGALATSPSALVFLHVFAPGCAAAKRCPGPGGLMRSDVALESVLRRALARAGIVEAFRHVWRALPVTSEPASRSAALSGGRAMNPWHQRLSNGSGMPRLAGVAPT
jgi:hypothetical protein